MSQPEPSQTESTPQSGPVSDLSAGDLPAGDQTRVNLGLQEHDHRIKQQLTVSNTAMCFIALLFMVAMAFGACLIYALLSTGGSNIHWHASILVAAFVVPPTVMMIVLVRAVYTPKQSDDALPIPSASLVKEISKALSNSGSN